MRVKTWEEQYAEPRSLRDMLRWANTHYRLVEELVSHRGLLEVGTGTGMLSAFVSRFCPRTVTIDNSAVVLANAGSLMSAVQAPVLAVRGDAFRLPFASDSFDACFSQGLLEHFADAEVDSLVAEQLRVAPVAYASVPSVFYPHIGRMGPGLVGNERLMTSQRWQRILARWAVSAEYYADFKVASFGGRTVPWPVHLLLRITHS